MLKQLMTKQDLMEFGEFCAERAIKKFCGEVKLKQRMTTHDVAERFNVLPKSVSNCYKKWGLKVIGHGPNGLNVFCGASVQRYEEKLKKKSEHATL